MPAPPSDAPLVAPVSDVTPLDKEASASTATTRTRTARSHATNISPNRRKEFAKLDINHDGKLSFEEWSVKAIAKFDAADADHNGKLTPAEFATTAVKRKPRTKAVCPPARRSRGGR